MHSDGLRSHMVDRKKMTDTIKYNILSIFLTSSHRGLHILYVLAHKRKRDGEIEHEGEKSKQRWSVSPRKEHVEQKLFIEMLIG